MSWYDAAAYCNWLSRKEGLPECYEIGPGGKDARVRPDALTLGGYRLPTEGEWEYACRAGTETSRFYGESLDLLDRYAWFSPGSRDHAWPCGGLMPNDLGLFDMLGNVYEWVQDANELGRPDHDNREVDTLLESDLVMDDNVPRILRGGTFANQPGYLRSAYRNWSLPSFHNGYYGFRVFKTCD